MSVYVSVELKRRIRVHFDSCCAYCRSHESLSIVTFEIEHIVPLALGGKTEFENLCLACPTCNRHKADRIGASVDGEGAIIAFFHPHRDRWTDHFAWIEDATRLVGLTVTGEVTIAAFRMNRPQIVRVRRLWVAMGEHPPDE